MMFISKRPKYLGLAQPHSPIHFLPKIAGHSGESKPREFHFWVHSDLGYPKVTELPNSKVDST